MINLFLIIIDIYLMADYYLNKSIEEQCRAFVSGFQEIIPYEWTHIFSPTEIQQIISGDSAQAIDVSGIIKSCIIVLFE